MKKIMAFMAAAAVICSPAVYHTKTVKTLDAAAIEESSQQPDAADAPDLDAPHREVTENNLKFNVYDGFAYISGCTDNTITEIVIPAEADGVPVIGVAEMAFVDCLNLTDVTLPDTLRYFNWEDICLTESPIPTVSKVSVSETNPYYTVSEGLLYSKDMKTLIGCPPAMGMKELKISDQTETIGNYAFAVCAGLEKAIIPSHIQHIGKSAFVACYDLVSAELPESITSIPTDIFYLCESLTEVTLKGNIERIENGAFCECTSLKDFVIPDSVNYIGMKAFDNAGCTENDNGVYYVQNWLVGSDTDVRNAIIKDGTIGVSEMAFLFRDDLELLDIPKSIKYTGKAMCCATHGCPLRINYRGSFIDEKTIALARTATDIYIYDPECEIFDSIKTIPAEYSVSDESSVSYNDWENVKTGDIVIHGYSNSTAQAYAEKYERKFELIEETSISGDVNGDGLFNLADVVLFQKWLLATPKAELADWKAADLYNDSQLDVFDLCLMKKQLIEKINEDSQNMDTSFKLQSVADIRTNGDSHAEWKGYIAHSEKEFKDIIQESEGISSQDILIEGIDKNSFNDKSLVIIYSLCSAGNRYSIIDDMTIKNNMITVSTITKDPMIATPDMLYRRYVYCIDKNTAANTADITFNDTSAFYQYEEGNNIVKWFEEWKSNSK